jgi:hypothetical protein
VFDKHIPLPASPSKWDFATADTGDSLAFPTKPEALKFAAAVRCYAGRTGKRWGTKMAETEKRWRVWIVGKEMQTATPAQAPYEPPVAFRAASTETDDDLGLRVDLRQGDTLIFERLPEARPIEAEDDPSDKPKRRHRPQPSTPKAADLTALMLQAAE